MKKIDYVDAKIIDYIYKNTPNYISKIARFLINYNLLNKENTLYIIDKTKEIPYEEFIDIIGKEKAAKIMVDLINNHEWYINEEIARKINYDDKLKNLILKEIYKNPMKAIEKINSWNPQISNEPINFLNIIKKIIELNKYSMDDKQKIMKALKKYPVCEMEHDNIKKFYIENTEESAIIIFDKIKKCLNQKIAQFLKEKCEQEILKNKQEYIRPINIKIVINFIEKIPLDYQIYKVLLKLYRKQDNPFYKNVIYTLIEKIQPNNILNDQELIDIIASLMKKEEGFDIIKEFEELINSEKIKNRIKQTIASYGDIEMAINYLKYYRKKEYMNIYEIAEILNLYNIKNYPNKILNTFNQQDQEDLKTLLNMNSTYYSKSINWYKLVKIN